jgi:hypothetical protein
MNHASKMALILSKNDTKVNHYAIYRFSLVEGDLKKILAEARSIP